MSASTPIVWLVCGGPSHERGVSISSARNAAARIESGRYEVYPVCIRRDGIWAIASTPLDTAADEEAIGAVLGALDGEGDPEAAGGIQLYSPGEAAAAARATGVGALLLILHGPVGEDGTIQGLLEMEGLAYTGSGVLASSLAMDKVRCQTFLASCGLPVSRFISEEGPFSDAEIQAFAERAVAEIGLPCVVKPSRSGSSYGVSIVRNAEDLPKALRDAEAVDPLTMVEKFAEGEELTCGLLQFVKDGKSVIRALPVVAIRPNIGEFYDYEAKYAPGGSDHLIPAPISDEAAAQIQALALRAFEAVGCRDMARVDFILGPQGPVVLEINTIPGLTATSLLPQAAAHAGLGFTELLNFLIQNALRRSGK